MGKRMLITYSDVGKSNVHTGPRSAVGNVSDCRSRGREFDPRRPHSGD